MSWTVPALAECDAGIEPTEFMVLIAMAEKPGKTSGGLIIPDAVREREQWGSEHGRILAISPLAFSYAEWPPTALRPKVGDIVFVGRYPGKECEGRDGRPYRLVSDREIAGIIERAPDPQAEAIAQLRAGLTARYAEIIEPLTRDIEGLFAAVGSDLTGPRTPAGGSVVVFDGDGIKTEGVPAALWGEASHKRVLTCIKALFPDHATARLYWRRRPEVSQQMFETDGPNECPVITLRIGADRIQMKEPADAARSR